jgi:hypothetical protein
MSEAVTIRQNPFTSIHSIIDNKNDKSRCISDEGTTDEILSGFNE